MHDAGFVRRDEARGDLPRDATARGRPAAGRRAEDASRGPIPATYGIVMYLMPSISPRSWMRTTFLWVTWRASSSSRLKRRSSRCAVAGSAVDVGPNHLDRDRDLELVVPRLIDRAHAADAEQRG